MRHDDLIWLVCSLRASTHVWNQFAAYPRSPSFLASVSARTAAACQMMTYYCVLNACKKAGQLHLVLELFQQMPSADVVSYNSVIAACDYTGQWQTLCLKELGRWVRDFHGLDARTGHIQGMT